MMKIFLYLVFLFWLPSCLAQTVTSTQLTNTKWKLIKPYFSYSDKTLSFSKTSVSFSSYYKDLKKTKTSNDRYYISNKIEKTFNGNNVGICGSGKYIVEEINNRAYCFQILSFTSQELKIILIPSKTLIGRPDTLVWKRIK